MINDVIEQHKSDLLKASCLGAVWAKENIGTQLEVAKVELAQLRKELAKKKEKTSHLEEEMQD